MVERFGDLLVDAGVLSREELDDALARRATDGELRIASELHALGVANERALATVLAREHGLPAVVLGESVLDLGALGLIPKIIAERNLVLPLAVDEEVLQVAVPDASMGGIMDQIAFASGRRVVAFIALKQLLKDTIAGAYEARARGDKVFAGPHALGDAPGLSLAAGPPPGGFDLPDIDALILHDDSVAPAVPAPAPRSAVPQPVDVPSFGGGLFDDDDGASGLPPDDETSAPEPAPTRVAPSPPRASLDDASSSDESSLPLSKPVAKLALKQIAVVRPSTPPPESSAPSPAPRAPSSAPAADQGNVAVVVEDDESIRRLVARALTHDGLTVLEAASGDEGVALLRQGKPRIIILDAMLPGVHGFEICARAKHSEAFRDVPVVMISAVYRGWEQAREIQEVHGADAFLEKPFDVHHLRKVVATLIGKPLERAPLDAARANEVMRIRAGVEECFVYGNWSAATAGVRQWLALDPFDPLAHLEAGNVHVQLGNLPWAMQSYETASLYEPRLYAAHVNLARVYEQLGFWKKARTTWHRAARTAPDPRTRAEIEARVEQLGRA